MGQGTHTYTQAEQHAHRCELVAALLSGNYEQGTTYLRPHCDTVEDGHRFCCLGVGCDISGLGEWTDMNDYCVIVDDGGNADRASSWLPDAVREYYGFADIRGTFTAEGREAIQAAGYELAVGLSVCLTEANDQGVTFALIAEWIAKGYVKTN
jgi:hypothetical protein